MFKRYALAFFLFLESRFRFSSLTLLYAGLFGGKALMLKLCLPRFFLIRLALGFGCQPSCLSFLLPLARSGGQRRAPFRFGSFPLLALRFQPRLLGSALSFFVQAFPFGCSFPF